MRTARDSATCTTTKPYIVYKSLNPVNSELQYLIAVSMQSGGHCLRVGRHMRQAPGAAMMFSNSNHVFVYQRVANGRKQF